RSARGVRSPEAGEPNRPRPACGIGFRVRDADGAHEPQSQPGRRDDLHDARRALHVCELASRQGSSVARRIGQGDRSGNCRAAAAREEARAGDVEGLNMLAARATRISVSPTMKVAAEAMALKAKGVDVIDLGAGEPDFPTPPHIGAAAKAAIDANFTKYTTNSGTDEFQRAIVPRYKTDVGIEYDTKEVIVTAGGKQSLYNAVMVLFGPGDEVITHMPGWPTLTEQIKLAEATPVIVYARAEEGFNLRAQMFID